MGIDDGRPPVFPGSRPSEPTAIIRFEVRAEISVIRHHESMGLVIPGRARNGFHREEPIPGAIGIEDGHWADRGL